MIIIIIITIIIIVVIVAFITCRSPILRHLKSDTFFMPFLVKAHNLLWSLGDIIINSSRSLYKLLLSLVMHTKWCRTGAGTILL